MSFAATPDGYGTLIVDASAAAAAPAEPNAGAVDGEDGVTVIDSAWVSVAATLSVT